jgi:hypothetical protein
MDLTKVLDQLRHELEHIDAAIHSLERLQAKEVRRGRPPKILQELGKFRPAVRKISSLRSARNRPPA